MFTIPICIQNAISTFVQCSYCVCSLFQSVTYYANLHTNQNSEHTQQERNREFLDLGLGRDKKCWTRQELVPCLQILGKMQQLASLQRLERRPPPASRCFTAAGDLQPLICLYMGLIYHRLILYNMHLYIALIIYYMYINLLYLYVCVCFYMLNIVNFIKIVYIYINKYNYFIC